MEEAHIVTQVAGSLQAESTDSEDGAEMIEESGGLASEASIHIMDNDDEVEVCDPSVGATKEQPKKQCLKEQQLRETTLGLAGAIEVAVKHVESVFTDQEALDFERIATGAPLAPALSSQGRNFTTHTSASDAFGIVYHPMPKVIDTGMPQRVSFEDEEEFERELKLSLHASASTIVGDSAADDEFSLEESKDNTEALRAAIANAQVKLSQAEEILQVSKPYPEKLADEDAGSSPSTTKSNLKEAAKTSLQELKQIYGSGLGDVSVRLLVEEEAHQNANQVDMLRVGNVSGMVIAEGSEEEDQVGETTDSTRQQSDISSEWENAPTYSPEASTLEAPTALQQRSSKLKYSTLLQWFQAQDLSNHRTGIHVEESATSALSRLFSTKMRFQGFEAQREVPFLIAQVPYDPSCPEHFLALQTIYKLLTGNSIDCAPTGTHWDVIGFQGLDPCTDLNRSMGMLSILQALRLCERWKSFAIQLHQSSVRYASDKSGGQDLSWPFMCVAIGFTRQALQTLRRGALNAECNRRSAVMSVLNDFFLGCFIEFYKRVAQQPSVHHAVHLAAIREMTQRRPQHILKACQQQPDAQEHEKVIEEFQDLEAAVQTTLVASPEAQSCESARAAKFRVP